MKWPLQDLLMGIGHIFLLLHPNPGGQIDVHLNNFFLQSGQFQTHPPATELVLVLQLNQGLIVQYIGLETNRADAFWVPETSELIGSILLEVYYQQV